MNDNKGLNQRKKKKKKGKKFRNKMLMTISRLVYM